MGSDNWLVKLEIRDKTGIKPDIIKFEGKDSIKQLIFHIKRKYGFNGDE